MELHNIHRVGQMNGMTLNVEEQSGLEVAMQERKLEENLVGPMLFWGKIFGTTQDYLVVYNVNPYKEFPEKTYYYCVTSNYLLKALPVLSEEYIALANKITSAYTGDPSFFAFNGDETEAEPEDPDAPPVERFRELHRLSHVVRLIEHDCAVVPRGSWVVDAGKKIIPNAYFTGIGYQSSLEIRSYMHFRRPESLQGVAMMKRPGIIKSTDFFDCVNKDTPSEMWAISTNTQGSITYVRNLYWEGHGFYTVLNGSEYGSVYFGNGVPSYDIAFML